MVRLDLSCIRRIGPPQAMSRPLYTTPTLCPRRIYFQKLELTKPAAVVVASAKERAGAHQQRHGQKEGRTVDRVGRGDEISARHCIAAA
jgi:hypothetical protein